MGGILQSVGQVIGSAKFIGDPVVELATVFKIIRIIFLVVVVLVFAKIEVNEEICKKSLLYKIDVINGKSIINIVPVTFTIVMAITLSESLAFSLEK